MSLLEATPAAPWHPRASIVLVTHNGVQSTVRCLEALSANTPGELYEVIVVDNGSVDGTPELLRSLGGDVRVELNDDNRGYILAANQGAALATGDYVVLLGSDTEPGPGWLDALIDLADSDPTVGIAGARIMSSWGTVRECGAVVHGDGAIERLGSGAHPRDPRFCFVRPADVVSCAAMLVRRDLWMAIGGLDQSLSPAFYEDAALCFAAWERGLRVLVHPGSSVVQHDRTAAGMEWLARYEPINRARFMETCGDAVKRLVEEDRPGPDRYLTRRLGARVLVIDPLPAEFDRSAGGERLIETLMRLRAHGCYVRLSTGWDEGMAETVEALRLLGVDVRTAGDPAAGIARRAWDEVTVFLYDLCDTAFDAIRDTAPGVPVAIDLGGRHFVPEPAEVTMQPAHPLWEAATDSRRAGVTERLAEALADGAPPLKLNLGCGPTPLPGYLNIDVVPLPGVDLAADAAALPQFPDGCAEEIRLDAVFAHIYRHERPAALSEWRRVLMPGGRLVLNWVPDFDALVEAYREGAPGFIHDEFELSEVARLSHGEYTAATVPYALHKDLFTVASVERELRAAGFDVQTVERTRYEGEHLAISINAVGVKPAAESSPLPPREHDHAVPPASGYAWRGVGVVIGSPVGVVGEPPSVPTRGERTERNAPAGAR